MKPTVHFGLAVAALAIALQASPALARDFGPPPPRCYDSEGKWIPCPENGFGSRIRVTLPRDKSPPAGGNTGIPVRKTPSNVEINAQPKYFRPN